MATEDFEDQLSRVRLMASGDPTWDLSPNDQAALTAVLNRLKEAEDAIEKLPKWMNLCRRAVSGLKSVGRFYYPDDEYSEPHSLDCSLAGRVSRIFCTGMTRSIELCRLCGEDPDYSEAAERLKQEREND